MLTLTDKETDSLTEVIFKSAQIDLRQYAKSSLKRRLVRLAEMHALKDIDQLLQFAANLKDTDKFIQEITVNTTELFRDPSFWTYIRHEVMPILNNYENIRIWHAGCSSGEEVISMQILLEELGMRHKVQVFATDINLAVLNVAQSATYSRKNLALSQQNYLQSQGISTLESYFSCYSDFQFSFRPALLSNVTFKRFDLVQDLPYSKFDLVLCRNVLIYFDFELQEKVINKYISSLFEGGFIAIGQKESIISPNLLSKIKAYNEAEKIYRINP